MQNFKRSRSPSAFADKTLQRESWGDRSALHKAVSRTFSQTQLLWAFQGHGHLEVSCGVGVVLPRVSEKAAPEGLLIQGCPRCAGSSPRWASLQLRQPGLSLLLRSAKQGTQPLPPDDGPNAPRG